MVYGKNNKKFHFLFVTLSFFLILSLVYLIVIPEPVKVETIKIRRGEFRKVIKVDGILRAKERFVITAWGDGDIKRVPFKVGDRVIKGKPITELFWSIKYLPVKSPIDGIVSKVFRESAGPISRGEPLVEVVDPDKLEITAELLTTDATQVEIGDDVFGEGWGGDGVLRGKIIRISKAGFIKPSALGVEEEKTEITADILEAPLGLQKLGSNFHLDVTIEIEKIQNVLKVPMGALFRSGDVWSVYQIIESRAVEKNVILKDRSNEEAIVDKGLREDDIVILFPGDLVRNGTSVEIKN